MSEPSRNSTCYCGSGQKYKHCCGRLNQPEQDDSNLTDDELFRLIVEADDDGLVNGEEPRQRAFMNVMRVLNKVRPGGSMLMGSNAPPIVGRIHAIINQIYRSADSGVGGMLLGTFMFRDIFAQVTVPIIVGHIAVEPLAHTDLSSGQKRWLQTRPTDYQILCDQFLDLTDFGYGLAELGHERKVSDETHKFMELARFQLEAAAATACVAYDFRGSVQSALLATELALKGGLAANGVSEEDLRKVFGHDHKKMASALATYETAFDLLRVIRVLNAFPALVPNRYSKTQPTRIETGEIIMGAQYVASEVMRQISSRNIRVDTQVPTPRAFPF